MLDALLPRIEAETPVEVEALRAERARLRTQIDNLLDSVAEGMPASTIVPQVKALEARVSELDVRLAVPVKPKAMLHA